jgi:CRISPR-associated endonuclease Csn1
MTKAINKSTAEHEQIRKLHTEFGIHRVTRNDIIRYKLWKESDGISIHRKTNRTIKIVLKRIRYRTYYPKITLVRR